MPESQLQMDLQGKGTPDLRGKTVLRDDGTISCACGVELQDVAAWLEHRGVCAKREGSNG